MNEELSIVPSFSETRIGIFVLPATVFSSILNNQNYPVNHKQIWEHVMAIYRSN